MRPAVTVVGVVVAATAFSQALNVTPVSDVVYGSPSDPTLVYTDLVVWNDTNVARDIWCTRVEVSIVPGSGNAFAWATSLPPGVATDPNPVSIAPFGYSDAHQGIYFPNGTSGSSVIRYCFSAQPSMADSACATITYDTGPNSTMEYVNDGPLFGYDAATDMLFALGGSFSELTIAVSDAAGRQVARFELHPGERISCSQLPPGSYMASAKGEGTMMVRFVRN